MIAVLFGQFAASLLALFLIEKGRKIGGGLLSISEEFESREQTKFNPANYIWNSVAHSMYLFYTWIWGYGGQLSTVQ